MLTKGIVSSFVDEYTLKVRIPRLDRVQDSAIKASNALLREAVICTVPNCHPNYHLGDIVFVEIDDQNEDEAIVMGQLYYDHESHTYSDYNMGELQVTNKATLPSNTSIGEISALEISYLKGLNKSLISELTFIKEKLSKLESRVLQLESEDN